MRGIFFYTIGIAIASGILFRSFFEVSDAGILFVLLISFSSGLLWYVRKRALNSYLFLLSLALLCFALGVVRFDMKDEVVSILETHVGESVELEGIILREPEVRETNVHLYVKLVESNDMILVTTDRFKSFAYGDRVVVAGKLKKPEAFESDLGRTFDYPGYLKARGVSYMISFGKAEVVAQGEGNAFMSALFFGKQKFMDALELAVPEPEAGLGEGVLLGAKRALGEKLEQAFRDVGIVHIIVLSGYNLMIIADIVMRVLSAVLRPRMRMVVGIFVIVSFALLVGLSATVIRASVMASLVIIARTLGRQYAVMRALVFAGTVMIFINPYLLLFDPGFQLSFLATLGLVVLAPAIEARLVRVPTKFHMREVLTTTLATQIFVLPFIVYLMGSFSVVSIVVNLLVLPAVPYAMLLSFIAGTLGVFSNMLGIIAGFPAYLLLAYIIKVAEAFAELPFASFIFPQIPFWTVIIAYSVIAFLAIHFREVPEGTLVQEEVDEDTHEDDEYADWTIEEEVEGEERTKIPVEVQGTSAGIRDTFPFR